MKQRPRIALSGYYGFDNAGDEAVLSGLVKNLYECDVDLNCITALSMSPDSTSADHGIDAAHRYRAGEVLQTLSQCDLLLSGGGSLLQDVTSAHGIFYYLAIVRAAQIMGKRTMFVAQGLGPLIRPRSRKLVAAVARKLDAITVRDTQSANLLREIGVAHVPVEVTADPALLLGIPPAPRKAVSRFGVALRPWGEQSAAQRVSDACRSIFPLAEAALFSMQPAKDEAVSDEFSAAWTKSGGKALNLIHLTEAGLSSLVREISSCEIMIGMRLHALILAAACGIPSVALSYDPKVTAFMESTGQGDACIDLSRQDLLEGVLREVWASREARAAKLQAHLPALLKAARRNGEIAVGLIR